MSITIGLRTPVWEPPAVTVPYEPGMSVSQALELAESQDGSAIKDPVYQRLAGITSRLLISLSGLGQNQQTGEYWMLYVNGAYPDDTGVDDTVLKDGDRVELRYERYEG